MSSRVYIDPSNLRSGRFECAQMDPEEHHLGRGACPASVEGRRVEHGFWLSARLRMPFLFGLLFSKISRGGSL